MIKNTFFLLAPLALLLFTQCNGCKENNCGSEYEVANSKCYCPEGKYEVNDLCKGLEPNEYYGVAPLDCNCRDSAFFLFKEKTPDLINGGYNLEVVMRFGSGYYENPLYDSNTLNFDYHETSDGIWLHGQTGITPGCPVNGETVTVRTYDALYSKDSDTIHLLEISSTQLTLFEERDTCVWILRR